MTHSPTPPPQDKHLWLAGVDGGGSSTRALVVSGDGQRSAHGRAGPSNPHHVGLEGARAAIAAALSEAWAHLGRPPEDIFSAFVGIAGMASFQGGERLCHGLQAVGLTDGTRIGVDHDLRIAHAGALQGGSGIVLIAGTGSAGFGRTEDGRTWRAGGWGWQLDDAGGGYWLAMRAIGAVLQAEDGRGPATALAERVWAFLGDPQTSAVPGLVQGLSKDRAKLAAFAPAVFKTAEQGDAVARDLVEQGASSLAEIAAAIGRRLFHGAPAPVALVGGLGSVPAYRLALEVSLARVAPYLRLEPAQHTPVVGAAILAARQAGRTPSAAWLAAADQAARG